MSEDETIAEHERLDAQARAIETGDLDPAEAARENEVIAELNAMTEPEGHEHADGLLLEFVPPHVAAAWRRARERVPFWFE